MRDKDHELVLDKDRTFVIPIINQKSKLHNQNYEPIQSKVM